MHEAGLLRPGSMAAIIGMDEALLAEVCRQTGTQIANVNCPGQLVISGDVENLTQAMDLAKTKGANRVIPLQVSGAFHTPLMQPAFDGMSEVVAKHGVDQHLELGRVLGEVDHAFFEPTEIGEPEEHEAVRKADIPFGLTQAVDGVSRGHGMTGDKGFHPVPDVAPDTAPLVNVPPFAVGPRGIVVVALRWLSDADDIAVPVNDVLERFAILHPGGGQDAG